MKLYRYTSKDGLYGIFEVISDCIDGYYDSAKYIEESLISFIFYVQQDLKEPTDYISSLKMTHSRSYFTEKGYRKFRKAIRDIIALLATVDIEIIRTEYESDKLSEKNDIIYEDEYQVVYSTKEKSIPKENNKLERFNDYYVGSSDSKWRVSNISTQYDTSGVEFKVG